MTRIFGLCPRCKSRIKINHVERLDGRKISCRDCGYVIRIRAPRTKLAATRKQADELEITEFYDEDDDDVVVEALEASAVGSLEDEEADWAAMERANSAPAYRPLAQRGQTRQRASQPERNSRNAFVPTEKETRKRKGMSPIKIVGIGIGIVFGFVVGFAGIGMLRSSGPAKFEAPERYKPIPVGLVPLAGQMPEGWKSTAGGGRRGIPIYVRISDRKSISIELRETEGSSAKGKMKKALLAGEELHQIGGPSIGRLGEAPSIESTHGYHKNVVMKNFSNYKESAAQPIETGFGMGLISDFTADEGLLHAKVRGCRASLVAREHQYSIVCKCPPAQFKDAKPVFEKIIASLNPDEGPSGRREPVDRDEEEGQKAKAAPGAAADPADKPDTDDERPGNAAPTPQ
jgi:hypothetical protein